MSRLYESNCISAREREISVFFCGASYRSHWCTKHGNRWLLSHQNFSVKDPALSVFAIRVSVHYRCSSIIIWIWELLCLRQHASGGRNKPIESYVLKWTFWKRMNRLSKGVTAFLSHVSRNVPQTAMSAPVVRTLLERVLFSWQDLRNSIHEGFRHTQTQVSSAHRFCNFEQLIRGAEVHLHTYANAWTMKRWKKVLFRYLKTFC